MLNTFEFYMPITVDKSIESGEDTKNEERILKGIASTEDIDADGEIVVQKGLDLSYFKKQGFINYHHRIEPEYIIGYPIKAEIVNKSFYLESKLIKGHKLADEVWNLAVTLEKENAPRKLGYSIQARVKERDGNIIKKALVYMVSVTPIPDNPNALTWTEVAKALTVGYEVEPALQVGGSALRVESLESDLKTLTLEDFNNFNKTIRELHDKLDSAIWEKYKDDWDSASMVSNFIWHTLLLNAKDLDDLSALVDTIISKL